MVLGETILQLVRSLWNVRYLVVDLGLHLFADRIFVLVKLKLFAVHILGPD